jgi:hypothetical protein
MTRPRAADDFPALRACMEELRRECVRVPADDGAMTAPSRPPQPAVACQPGGVSTGDYSPAVAPMTARKAGRTSRRTIYVSHG